MQEEAEKHAEEDQKRREFIETKNQADRIISQAETQIDNFEDAVDADLIADIEDAIDDVKAAKEDAEEIDDLEEAKETIDAAIEDLEDTLQQIGQEMYGDQAGPGGMGGVDPSQMSEEDLKQAAQNMGVDPSKVQGADETMNMDGDDDVVDADYEEVDDEGDD